METQEKLISNEELFNEIKKLQAQISDMRYGVDNTNSILINHIGFINKVFDTIKKPLFFIMNKVNSLLTLENIPQVLTE